MEKKPKKRIYDEDYSEESMLDFKGSPKKDTSKTEIKPSENKEDNVRSIPSDKNTNLIDRTLNTVDKASRGIDALFNQNYKDYKIDTKGKSNLSQFTDQELKFLNRDFKIANKDNTEIKSAIASRSIDIKAFNNSAKVETLYNIKTDKGNISLGVDKTTGDIKISENNYKNNPNIKTWRDLNTNDLSKALIAQGDIKEFRIDNKINSIKRPDISNDNLGKLHYEIINAVGKSQAKNFVPALDSKALQNPNLLKGQIIQTKENDVVQLYKVLASDKDNLTIQNISGRDNNAYLVNVKTEKENAMAREIQVTGILDKKTVIGHNHTNNETYIGTVSKDKSVDWQTKPEFMKAQTVERRNDISSKLESGDYRMSNVTAVGRVEGGNILYAAEKGNKELVLTANQETWVNAKGKVGEALLSLSGGMDINAVRAMVDANNHSFNSARETNNMISYAHSQQEQNQERSLSNSQNISNTISR